MGQLLPRLGQLLFEVLNLSTQESGLNGTSAWLPCQATLISTYFIDDMRRFVSLVN